MTLSRRSLLAALCAAPPLGSAPPGAAPVPLTLQGHESSLLIQGADQVFTVRLKLRCLL